MALRATVQAALSSALHYDLGRKFVFACLELYEVWQFLVSVERDEYCPYVIPLVSRADDRDFLSGRPWCHVRGKNVY